jgi:SAM-dependent methyltransferase
MQSRLDAFVDAYGDDFAYSFDNRIILNWYPRRILAFTPPEARVLELGVGHGYTCDAFARRFAAYEVVDGSEAVIARFRQTFPDSPARLRHGWFESFAPEAPCDLIVFGFVLEHVEDPGALLRRYRDFLAPGGRIAVAVPNAASLHRRVGQAAGLLEDLTALGPGDLALGHRRAYTVETLEAELAAAGYATTRREGIFLKPFTTGQMTALALSDAVIEGLCAVGVDYPELCAALLFEAEVAG